MRPYYQSVSYRILKMCFRTIRVRLPGGTIAVRCRDRCALASLFWVPSWRTELIAQALDLRAGAFLDVGANVGQSLFDFIAAGSDRRYFGFEPNLRCAEYLGRLIDDNSLAMAAVIPVALGNQCSILTLRGMAGHEADSSAFIHSFIRPKLMTWNRFIPCMRYDDVSGSMGIGHVACCKIDVEGFELEVLQGMAGMLAAERPPILCEVLDADPAADMRLHEERILMLEDWLRGAGYEMRRILKTPSGMYAGLELCVGLPRKHWAKASEDECDYLFTQPADPLAHARPAAPGMA